MKRIVLLLSLFSIFVLSGCSLGDYNYKDELSEYENVSILADGKSYILYIDLIDSMVLKDNGVLEVEYRDYSLYIFKGDYIITFYDKVTLD